MKRLIVTHLLFMLAGIALGEMLGEYNFERKETKMVNSFIECASGIKGGACYFPDRLLFKNLTLPENAK